MPEDKPSSPMERFEDLARRLFSIPKKEAEKIEEGIEEFEESIEPREPTVEE